MHLTGLVVAVAVLFPVPAPQNKAASEAEMRSLQGTWKLIHGEYEGRRFSDDAYQLTKLTVANEEYRLSVVRFETVGQISLNHDSTPKEIDVAFDDHPGWFKKHVQRGIYHVVGDFLFIVFKGDVGKEQERPKTFDGPRGSEHRLYLFRRANTTQ